MVTCCKLITPKFRRVLLRWKQHPDQPAAGCPAGSGTWVLTTSRQILCEVEGPWHCTPLVAQVGVSYFGCIASKPPEPAQAVTCVPNPGEGRHRQRARGELWDLTPESQAGHKQVTFPLLPEQARASLSAAASAFREQRGGAGTEHRSHSPAAATSCRGEMFHSGERADLLQLHWGAQSLEHQRLENRSLEKGQGQSC